MSKEKLVEARSLIQQKQYDAARAILDTLPNDPTAQQWLTRLNQIAPRRETPVSQESKAQTSGSGVVNFLIAAVAVVILLILVGAGGYFAGRSSGKEQGQQNGRATAAQEYVVALAQTRAAIPSPSSTATITLTPTIFDITLEPTLACNVEISTWWNDEAGPLVQEFLDVAETSAATSRGNLSALILELSRVKRDYENNINSIHCGKGEDIRASVAVAMGFTVDGFNDFLASNDDGVWLNFTLANSAFAKTYAGLLDYYAVNEFRMRDTSLIWGGDPYILETLTPAPEGARFSSTVVTTPRPRNEH